MRGLVNEVASHGHRLAARPGRIERSLAAVAMCVGGLALARSVRDSAYAGADPRVEW